MKKISWLIVLIALASFSFAACGSQSAPPEDDKGTVNDGGSREATNVRDPKSISDEWIQNGKFTYKIVESIIVDGYKLGGVESDKEDGTVYVWVKFNVKNDTSDEISFSSIFADPKLKSIDGKEFPGEVLTDGILDGKIKPGKTAVGEWYFKVPGDKTLSVSGWLMTMQSQDIFSDEIVELKLP